MWIASIDTRTGRPPQTEHVPKRVYRLIGAPRGSTLYWDQPLIVTAFELSRITGNQKYAQAAEQYIKAFMEHCVDDDGMFLWGNHKYYDVYEDKIVRFSGGYHELRPITPAWELFWRYAPKRCEAYIRKMSASHVYDRNTGGFNRHDDEKRGHAFIEAGGILVESLAWLYKKTKDRELLDMALRIARYSYNHRGKATGLIINEPDKGRWDSKVCTAEVGVWSQSLIRAAKYSSNNEFVEMAQHALSAYLEYGYDESNVSYYGQLNVTDGKPVVPEQLGYWPRKYSNIWNQDQWPTHDYPMAVAEASLELYKLTSREIFLEGVKRCAQVIRRNSPARQQISAYAEQYGRCISFLAKAGRTLNDEKLLRLAHELADEATKRLFDNSMFGGFAGSHMYESVDGVGYLCLALISLETGEDIDSFGLDF
jgi:mannose/cellobiose epimerase-like protein (N-acyl-D-glucosamine 2-epimerase family)